MSQIPPAIGTPAPGAQPLAPRSNPLAIVSLICGIVGCLGITPLIGIITGFLALGKSKLSGGKGMAIAGIVLSFLWIGILAVAIGGSYWGYGKIQAMVAEATKEPTMAFLNDLAEGNIAAAENESSISQEQLQALSTKLQGYGKCTDVNVGLPSYQNTNGNLIISFQGAATFENAGQKSISATFTGSDDMLIIQSIEVE